MATGNMIGHEVKILSNLINRYMDAKVARQNELFGENGLGNSNNELTGMQSLFIKYLYDNDSKEIFQRDIEKKFNLRRPTATGILKLMEKQGLIEKTGVSYDARLKKIELTAKAIKRHLLIEHDIMEFEAKMRQGLSEEQIDDFLETIRKIRANIEENNNKE